jgi:hypothetical protein
MYKASYQFHDRAVELDCVLLGEHRRDIGIALASRPQQQLTVLKMHGPAESVAANDLDEATFVSNRIGQAEMQRELHGVLTDALKGA